MKRLTKKVDGAWTAICEYGNPPYPVVTQDVIDRLAAIEDILGDEYDLGRLRELVEAYREDRYIVLKEPRQAGVHRLSELAEADREGRCVVMPCKVGDTVYVVGTCKEIGLFFDDECFWPEETNCPFEDSCDAEECEENHIRIFETLVTDFWIGEQNENHPEVFLESISEGKMVSDFGKTVFRDKEEAQAALERMKSNG